jgi:HK97 family phage major capsid protein
MALPELREKKGRLFTEAQAILDQAQAEGREATTPEELAKFTAIHKDIDTLSEQIRAWEKQDEVQRELSGGQRQVSHNTTTTEPNPSRLMLSKRDQQDAVRGWFLAGAKSLPLDARYANAARKVGLDLNSNQLTYRMAARALPSRTSEELRMWQQFHEEERAMAGPQSTTSLGGFTIQDEAMREVEVAILSFGAMRRAGCTVIRTDAGGPMPIPTVNDSTNVGSLIGQGVTVGTQDATFGQLVLDAWKYTSKSVLVSVELMQDNSVNLAALLGRLLGERIGRITNTHFTTGTGTGNPNGVVTAATFTQATTGNTTAITLNNLLALYHSLDPGYRDNAKFMMNDNSLMKIKQMIDSQGRPLWLPGLVDRAPDTILGSPYVINQDMATMTISAKSILFGDFSKYWIRDVRDVTLVRLDERFAEFLQVGFLAFSRTDGDLLDAGTHPIMGYQNST